MHPRARAKFGRHVARVLQPDEKLLAGVRATTGGYIARQNLAILFSIGACAAYGFYRLFGLGESFGSWEGIGLLSLLLVATISGVQWLHARARAAIVRQAEGETADVLRATTLLLAVTDRRLLVFARSGWQWGLGMLRPRFGALLASYAPASIEAIRTGKSRAFPARMPLVHIDLSCGSTLDLELMSFDNPADFLGALENLRTRAKRAARRRA